MPEPLFRPIFLHFIAGELRDIAPPSRRWTLTAALRVLALSSSPSLYIPYSALWENPAVNPANVAFCRFLIDHGQIHTLGYQGDVDEFLESRQALYVHDRARYPAYFDVTRSRHLLRVPVSDAALADTTVALEATIISWAATKQSLFKHPSHKGLEKLVKPIVLDALGVRGQEALTYSYLRPFVQRAGFESRASEMLLRRMLFEFYVNHYLGHLDADIATGWPTVAAFSDFDLRIARNYPSNDLNVLRFVLERLGLAPVLRGPWREHRAHWSAVAEARASRSHQRFTDTLRAVLHGAALFCEAEGAKPSDLPSSVTRAVGPYIEPVQRAWEVGTFYEQGITALSNSVRRIISGGGGFATHVSATAASLDAMRADVLVATATDVETSAVLAAFGFGRGAEAIRRVFDDHNAYADLGIHGGARIVLVQSEMGAGGPAGSQQVINEALNTFRPYVICMVGIAFGVPSKRQRLGDVLVSTRLQDYELARVGQDGHGRKRLVARGARPDVSPLLTGIFRLAAKDWDDDRVHFGVLLSGDKLIDNEDFRDEILHFTGGEAIGGEMEGRGLYSAAAGRAHWIVVKAVCDWADGNKRVNKGRRQATAARRAAEFTRHAIRRGGFVHG